MRGFFGGLIFAASPLLAHAAEHPAPAFDYEVGVVSDYRYRGLSLSDKAPAFQAGVSASTPGGLYGSIWSSTIDEYGAGADGEGATVELDYALGWASAIAGFDVDVAVTRYTYPGGEDVDFIEFPVSASRGGDAWTATVGASYAPRQKALGTEGDGYGFARMEWAAPSGAVTVAAQAGYETGAFAPGGKWDWSVSASGKLGPVEAGLSFIDSSRASNAVVASLKAAF